MFTGRAIAALAAAALAIGGCSSAILYDQDSAHAGALSESKSGTTGAPHPVNGVAAHPPDKDPPPDLGPNGPGRQVFVCHRSHRAGGPGETLLLPPAAVAAHLAHGDTLGPCEDDEPCRDVDSDGDGVIDCKDACEGTPPGEDVDEHGCSKLVIRVDAGPDVSVEAGALVVVEASLEVVQGNPSQGSFVWAWGQNGGSLVPFEANGRFFTFDTTGMSGAFAFRVKVHHADAAATASDDFVVNVDSVEVLHLTVGRWHNAVHFSDGHIRTWGWGTAGQLGDGSLTDGVADVDAKAQHTVVALNDGTVWTFGSNALNNSATPVQVPGASDVVMVSAMERGAILLQSDGGLLGFTVPGGECSLGGAAVVDENGQIAAVAVQDAPADVVQIATGFGHVVALDAGGTAWVWGSRFGCTPKPVLTNVVAIAAGDTDSCLFARNDGTAWGLGFNLHGQLGNGTTVSNYLTVRPVSGLSNVVSVAAGDRHSFFLTADGDLWAAGWNRYCQLGLEDEPTPEAHQFGFTITQPVQVNLFDVTSIAGGELHAIAATADGRLWAWGMNNVGQLHGNTFSVLPSQVCAPMEIELE